MAGVKCTDRAMVTGWRIVQIRKNGRGPGKRANASGKRRAESLGAPGHSRHILLLKRHAG